MPLVNPSERTLQVKIVYYGPGLSGKTTNLEHLSEELDPDRTGDLMSLDTTGDRTLFFDWMPFDLGKIKGFDVKVQLFTVPGQVRYNATRKQVLKGVDGLVFVADSQVEAIDQNRFAFQNLRENLAEQAIDLEEMPLVIQWNKRDLPSALPGADLASRLSLEHYPQVDAVASRGEGVVETLRQITRITLHNVRQALDPNAKVEEEQMPLDGNSLMSAIMAAGVDVDEASDEELPEILGGDAGLLTDHGDPYLAANDHPDGDTLFGDGDLAAAGMGEIARKLPLFERELRLLNGALRGVYEKLPGRVADAVEREVEPTVERVSDIESRLGIMHRAITALGKRVAVLERRASRLELQGGGGGTRSFTEMARLFEELAEVMGRMANESQPAQAGSKGEES